MTGTDGPRSRAVITGASSGIGAAYAERLARDGYDLTVIARRQERLEDLARRLEGETGVDVSILVADLTESVGIRSVEDEITREPHLTMLVNNAGFAGYMPFIELDPAEAERLIQIHATATTRLTRAALPGMLSRGYGAIVNIASLLAFSESLPPVPLPYRATYAGCKAYIVAFTQTLQHEVHDTGIQLQVCCPGLVATEFHEVARIDRSRLATVPMSAEEVVQASLTGLGLGEVICIPGLENPERIDEYHRHQAALLREGNVTTLATRYRGEE